MVHDLDRYEALCVEKLWNLLPSIYRAEDSPDFDRKGPLREMVERVGAQAAVALRSLDRLWEDQSIETCDDWAIAYLGELLSTNLVSSLDARGQRLDVAKTIYYRRRKGTVALLEELAGDITGWSARVVEFFRRMGRTRHALDPAVGLPVAAPDPRFALQRAQGLIGARTQTGAGGFADLRNVHGAALTGTAFDEYFHSADVRRGRGKTGWHDIPRLGIFVWRLRSFGVQQTTPVRDSKCPNQYTFDPTGRNVPLFAEGSREFGDQWISPEPQQMPGPISTDLLRTSFDDLYRAAGRHALPASIAVYRKSGPLYDLIPPAEIARDPRKRSGKPWIDAERGRIVWPSAPTDGPFRVDYHCGFSSEIGAGAYDRFPSSAPVDPAPVTHVDGGAALAPPGTGTLVIDDSLTYPSISDGTGIVAGAVRAANRQRPVVRTEPAAAAWTFTGTAGGTLALGGIFLSGGTDLVLAGSFDQVILSCCTLDPGNWDPEGTPPDFGLAADGRPLQATRLRVLGQVRRLTLDRCITGPILTQGSGEVEDLRIQESIVQAARPGTNAISLISGEVRLSRCTLLGPAQIHRFDASECILHDVVAVEDRQHGCVRFCAWSTGSALPRQYESVELRPRSGLFASLELGRPEYAQLLPTAGGGTAEGAEDGSEMGALWRERSAIKERSLLIKYQEYLPLGLEPVVVHVT
jgi:hypothetical protein